MPILFLHEFPIRSQEETVRVASAAGGTWGREVGGGNRKEGRK